MDKKTKEMIEDIRSTPNSFLTREGCLELFETIEQQQEEIKTLSKTAKYWMNICMSERKEIEWLKEDNQEMQKMIDYYRGLDINKENERLKEELNKSNRYFKLK